VLKKEQTSSGSTWPLSKTGGAIFGVTRPIREADQSHLLLKLRMDGFIIPLPLTHSWILHGNFYFIIIMLFNI